MKRVSDQIIEIIRTKGDTLALDDLHEINMLLVTVDPDDFLDQQGAAYEAISLIVNDPLYEGDIPPIE